MFSVIVRRSTLTIRSTIGIRRKRPGPLRLGEQPAEPEDDAALVLARDLDRREQEEQQQDDDDDDDDDGGGHGSFRGCAGSYDGRGSSGARARRARARPRRRRPPRRPARAARRRRARLPELAADGDEPSGAHDARAAPTSVVRARPPPARRRAWTTFASANAKKSRARAGDPERDRQRDLVRRSRRGVEEQQRAEDEADRARHASSAPWLKRRRARRSRRRTRARISSEPGPADGQHVEPEEARSTRQSAPNVPGRSGRGARARR